MTSNTSNHNLDIGNETCIMNTRSGLRVDLLRPQPAMFSIQDIATGLSNQGHFCGQSPIFFSIAQHCMLALHGYYKLFPKAPINDPVALAVLMHDAAEAYVGDLIKPIKNRLPEFSIIENRILFAIGDRFGIDNTLWESVLVKTADRWAQEKEYECFYHGDHRHIKMFLGPSEAYSMFLSTFSDLYDA